VEPRPPRRRLETSNIRAGAKYRTQHAVELGSESLEDALGYQFVNRQLLARAFTHRSSVHEKPLSAPATDNEQLEFLGDAILGFVVSDVLVAAHPDYPEGRLSKLKAQLVSSSHLYAVAARLRLGDYLLLGRGEEMSGGREKKALLANAVEALIAALYLDGGIEPTRRFIVQHVIGDAEPLGELSIATDYKSALQELAQSMKLPQPRYAIVEERGPEHSKTFLVEVRVGREWVSRAEGLSKKSAGQKAAQEVLRQLAESSS
jgi:ribonuclease III